MFTALANFFNHKFVTGFTGFKGFPGDDEGVGASSEESYPSEDGEDVPSQLLGMFGDEAGVDTVPTEFKQLVIRKLSKIIASSPVLYL